MSSCVSVGLGSHRSVAFASLRSADAGHSMVCGPPTPVITGAVLSCTVMVWLACLELPQWSVVVQVRVMLKIWPHVPGVTKSLCVNVGSGSHTSLAVGSLKIGDAEHSI